MSKTFAARFKPKAWTEKSKPNQRYRRRKIVKLDVRRTNSSKHYKSSSLYLDGGRAYLHPYMDSLSWLYLEPANSPTLATTAATPYALPPPCRTNRRHHHHHHQHRHHRTYYQPPPRRVSSEPGTWRNNCVGITQQKHRRVYSLDDKMDCATGMRADEEDFRETRTSTFRKVPWHPNLHMLKIRRA